MGNLSNPFIVSRITFRQTRLIDHANAFHANVNIFDAQRLAQSNGLQLVCFALPEGDELALCKIVDYGKWKYENEKRLKKISKENKHSVKEIRFGVHIDKGDIEHKIKHAKEFISDGDEVVLHMKIFGRDCTHMDLANQKMSDIIIQCSDVAKVVGRNQVDNNIVVRLARK